MNTMYDIFTYPIYNLSAESSGKIWSFNDLCQRIYPSYPDCYAFEENLFGLWQNIPESWQTKDDINSVIYTQYGQEIIGVTFCVFVLNIFLFVFKCLF